MKNYDKEIEELETKLKILKEEKKKFDLLRPNLKLAEIIHNAFCESIHSNGCTWYHESWEGFGDNSTRMKYLDRANKILEKVTYKDAVHIISVLSPIK
jgi:hypothetical protein